MSGHFHLESRTWQRIFYHKIWVGRHFQGDWIFLTMGQECEGNAILLFKGWNLGSLLVSKPGSTAFNLTIDARQSIWKGGGHGGSVSQIRGTWANLCFQIAWWYEHSSKTIFSTMIVWVLRALMIYCLYFPSNSRCFVQCQSQSHSPQPLYEDRWQHLTSPIGYEPGSASFPILPRPWPTVCIPTSPIVLAGHTRRKV